MSLIWRGDQALAAARAGGEAGLLAAAGAVLARSQARVPVDSGELRASGSVQAQGTRATVRYAAPHAPLVHQGTSRMPARPFLADALDGADVLTKIASGIKL